MSELPIGEEDLHGYVDDALTETRRQEVEAYLASHPDVARRVATYSAQRDALRKAYDSAAEEPIPVRLNIDHIVARRKSPMWQAAAACALLAVGVAAGWWGHGAAPRNGIGSLAQEGIASYAVYAPDTVRPVEIKASDSAELIDWASRRLNHPVKVPNLAASGYQLMGGRIVVTPHGPAVMMMYADNAGARLALISRPMAIDKNRRMASHGEEGVSGFVWSDNGVGYDLVGRASISELHPLADEARRQILGRV